MTDIVDKLKEEAERIDYTSHGPSAVFDYDFFVELILREAVHAVPSNDY